MDPAKVKAWQRFYDQVLSGSDWPRGLWFAAVEDALRAAFGADSRLLADYRADVAELLRLERAASGSYHDEKRRAQLEAQIKRLIELADETMHAGRGAGEPAPAATIAPRRPPSARAASPGRAGRWSRGGAAARRRRRTAYYELRMAARPTSRSHR